MLIYYSKGINLTGECFVVLDKSQVIYNIRYRPTVVVSSN